MDTRGVTMRGSRLIIAALCCLGIVGCGTPGPTQIPTPTSPIAPMATPRRVTVSPASSPAGSPTAASHADVLVLVSLGDSWPAGGHCAGCRTFAGRYADDLKASLGTNVRFVDLAESVVPGTQRGATADSLYEELRTSDALRRQVAAADIIVVSVGLNSLDEGPLDAFKAGTCGGPDDADCFSALGPRWRAAYGGILDEIETLRGDLPTAIRLVTAQNVFLDPSLADEFGPAFAADQGAMAVGLLADAMCDAASWHRVTCVDVRPILNGPDLDRPADENADAAHQAVANALIDTGLDELGLSVPHR